MHDAHEKDPLNAIAINIQQRFSRDEVISCNACCYLHGGEQQARDCEGVLYQFEED